MQSSSLDKLAVEVNQKNAFLSMKSKKIGDESILKNIYSITALKFRDINVSTFFFFFLLIAFSEQIDIMERFRSFLHR